MFPAVHSVSVVPVGVTKYRDGLYPLRPYTREEAGAVVDQVEAFAAAHRDAHGTALVWCSDEFYLLAGAGPCRRRTTTRSSPSWTTGWGCSACCARNSAGAWT